MMTLDEIAVRIGELTQKLDFAHHDAKRLLHDAIEAIRSKVDDTIYCGTYRRVEDGEILNGPLVRYEALRECEERYQKLSSQRQKELASHHELEEMYRHQLMDFGLSHSPKK